MSKGKGRQIKEDREDKVNNDKSRRSNSSRRNKRPRRSTSKEMDKTMRTGGNDPAWYSRSPELLRDSAQIPFSWPVGTQINVNPAVNYDISPGIATLELSSCVGRSSDQNSPINVASNAIYSWVRHANSGHSNYDAPDLMIYLIAMSSMYSFITWVQRLYGMANIYDQRNRYLPKNLLIANHVNYESIRDNLANFRFWLNNLITKVSSLAVPNTMPYFNRLAFLYSNYYIEGPSIKDQLYMYVPFDLQWFMFSIDSTTHMGGLTVQKMNPAAADGLATVQEIMAFGDTLFGAIWSQEDFGIMSGDILKAYGDNIIKLAPIGEEFVLLPIYDALFLHQFKNAKLSATIVAGAISQTSNGLLTQNLQVTTGGSGLARNLGKAWAQFERILSSDFDSPGPDIVIESTRLMPTIYDNSNSISAGTEIPKKLCIYLKNANGTSRKFEVDETTMMFNGSTMEAALRNEFNTIQMVSCFKYAPEIMVWNVIDDNYAQGGGARIWDIDNYAVLSPNDLDKMHQAALMSLFAVDAVAKL